MLTIQDLLDDARQLEQQVEAASNMLQQTAGALQFVRNKIGQLQAVHEEAARKAKEDQEKKDGEANDQGESETPQE